MSKIEIAKTELFKYDLYLKVLKIAADLKQVVRTSNLVKKIMHSILYKHISIHVQ